MSFKEEILSLISLKAEGGYWDFKQKWHNSHPDLLHDIICMANNLENHDAYIIFGVTDEGIICGVPEEDRKNQQNVIDFLKDKKFAGGVRPTVYVRTLALEKQIDVLIIKNSPNTPYYLTDVFQSVFNGNIYTRIGDTNTPKKSTADIDKTEYLWRKRFGLDLSPLEKVKFLLHNPKEWLPIGTDGEHSSGQYTNIGKYYHKRFPEFTLDYGKCESQFDEGRIRTLEYEYYWLHKLPSLIHNSYIYNLCIKYYSTTLYSALVVSADNTRFERVLWKKKILFPNLSGEDIFYCYVEKDSIEFAIDNWLSNLHDTIPDIEESPLVDPLKPWSLQPEYKDCNPYDVVPVFSDSQEHHDFRQYVKEQKTNFLNIIGDYSFSKSKYKSTCPKCNAPDYTEYLCQSGKALVQWLNEWKKQLSSYH